MVAQPFVSTKENKLDAKHRVSIPAPFRQVLAKQDLTGFYFLKSDRHPALECFGKPVLEFYENRQVSADPLRNEDYDIHAQDIFGECDLLEFDDQGRVTLPSEVIEFLGVTDRVVFVGMNQKFEIWDPEHFVTVREERIARARASTKPRGTAP
jgi:MraZ protein